MKHRKVLLTVMALSAAVSSPAMYAGMTEYVAAADTKTVPSSKDRATLTVKGVEADAKVYACKVVGATYNSCGLTGYKQTSESKKVWAIKDIENPTDEDVTELARWVYSLEESKLTELKYDASTGNFSTNKAQAGSYIVIVRKNYDDTPENEGGSTEATYVYNPMYLSNAYTDAGDAGSLGKTAAFDSKDKLGDPVKINAGGRGEADAGTSFGYETVNEYGAKDDEMDVIVTRDTAYAKKTPVTLEKNIVNASTKSLKWEDVAVGDTVTLELLALTPDYSAAFEAGSDAAPEKTDEDGHKLTSIYRLTDKQSAGLDPVTEDSIETVATYTLDSKGRRKEVPVDKKHYSVTFFENDLYIDFDTDWLIAHPASSVVVRYHTKVNDSARLAAERETNRARLDYYTLPNGETDVLKDIVEFYSFGIDNIYKITEDGSIIVNDDKSITARGPLAGAVFTLTRKGTADSSHDDSRTVSPRKEYVTRSDEDGCIYFEGLDEGVYTLQETEAPQGYFLSGKTWTVTVSAEYDGFEDLGGTDYRFVEDDSVRDRALRGYSVRIVDDVTGDTADSNYFAGGDEEISAWGIVNGHLSRLPSTGGMGTIAFTAGGIALAGGGAMIVFSGRKKKDDRR